MFGESLELELTRQEVRIMISNHAKDKCVLCKSGRRRPPSPPSQYITRSMYYRPRKSKGQSILFPFFFRGCFLDE